MSEIQNNSGSISGNITSESVVNGGALQPKGSVQGGAISRNQGGTKDYERLTNLPQVNDVTLIGNKTSEDLHIVACKTSAEWAALTTLVSMPGEVYVYSDGGTDAQGNPIPMIKIGDGNAYVVDLPFTTAIDFRITQADIDNWNGKVSVRIEGDRLIFY